MVNLGVDLWTVASVVKKLFQYEVFGGLDMDESDRYLIAYDLFKSWSRTNKVWHLSRISAGDVPYIDVLYICHIYIYLIISNIFVCKPRHSMPKFRPWRFRSKLHPWPELQSKAYNAPCWIARLRHV